jgi:hypothetical protein
VLAYGDAVVKVQVCRPEVLRVLLSSFGHLPLALQLRLMRCLRHLTSEPEVLQVLEEVSWQLRLWRSERHAGPPARPGVSWRGNKRRFAADGCERQAHRAVRVMAGCSWQNDPTAVPSRDAPPSPSPSPPLAPPPAQAGAIRFFLSCLTRQDCGELHHEALVSLHALCQLSKARQEQAAAAGITAALCQLATRTTVSRPSLPPGDSALAPLVNLLGHISPLDTPRSYIFP